MSREGSTCRLSERRWRWNTAAETTLMGSMPGRSVASASKETSGSAFHIRSCQRASETDAPSDRQNSELHWASAALPPAACPPVVVGARAPAFPQRGTVSLDLSRRLFRRRRLCSAAARTSSSPSPRARSMASTTSPERSREEAKVTSASQRSNEADGLSVSIGPAPAPAACAGSCPGESQGDPSEWRVKRPAMEGASSTPAGARELCACECKNAATSERDRTAFAACC
mmetsp:Transcript_2887/g.9453  ORF Transcript_2887/g.9453 Transcript_2887/m.9453 type:complete len:229 (-) Transcript_2887:238-924(-)